MYICFFFLAPERNGGGSGEVKGLPCMTRGRKRDENDLIQGLACLSAWITHLWRITYILLFFFLSAVFSFASPLLKAFCPLAAKRFSGKYFRVTGFMLSFTY